LAEGVEEAGMMRHDPLPWFYAVNDPPVKIDEDGVGRAGRGRFDEAGAGACSRGGGVVREAHDGADVRDFGNESRYVRTKLTLQFFARCLGVFDRVMQKRRDHYRRVFTLGGLGHETRDLSQMVDVRLGGTSFGALVPVLSRGEVQGTHQVHDDLAHATSWNSRFRERSSAPVIDASSLASRDRSLRSCELLPTSLVSRLAADLAPANRSTPSASGVTAPRPEGDGDH
jgi:hypothetical protein